MTASSRAPEKILAALGQKYSRKELRAVFALIRAKTDAELLRAPPATPARAKPKANALLGDVRAILQPLLAPTGEKADMLVEHMTNPQGHPSDRPPPKGLAHALRLLKQRFTDAEIRAGAKGLIATLARSSATRETVT